MPAVSGGYLGSGQRRRIPVKQSPSPQKAPATVAPRPEVSVGQIRQRPAAVPRAPRSVNPAVNPRAAGPIQPQQAVRVRRNTAITQSLATPAFSRQQRDAARHVARAVYHVATGTPAPPRPLKDHEVKAILTSPQGRQILSSAERATRQPAHAQHRSIIQQALDVAFNRKPLIAGTGSRYFTAGTAQAPLSGGIAGRAAETAAIAGYNTGRAFFEHPIKVGTRTAGGAGQLAIGAIAAVPEIGIRTVHGALHGDPLEGVKSVGKSAAADFSRRYGGIYRGDPGAAKAFRQRIVKEGAASEILDAATIAAPEGAIAGRVLGKAARAGSLGPRLERFATEARPALRQSGQAARPQDLSKNLFRAAAQRGEDVVRQQRLSGAGKKVGPVRVIPRGRNVKAAERDKPLSGLQPRPNEVVPATKSLQRRAQRVLVSQIAARIHESFKREQHLELDAGARRELSKLNKHQRAAATTAIQGLVTAHDPVAAIEQLKARNREIIAQRTADTARRAEVGVGPRAIPAKRSIESVNHGDELALNNYLIAHAKDIFTHKFAEFQQREAQRSIRVAAEAQDAHPVFRSSTAEVRRLRVQGEALKVPYEYEVARHAIEAKLAQDLRGAKTAEERSAATAAHDLATQELEQRKPQIDAQYTAEVRAKAKAAGLPEPGYVAHFPRQDYGFSDYTSGGAKAIAGVQRTELRFHRLGIADTHPQRYVQSLARTIKYKHNWPGVTAQAEASMFKLHDIASPEEARNILESRGPVNEANLSIEDWRRILHAKGLDPTDYAFWNPGRLKAEQVRNKAEGHPADALDHGTGVDEGSAGLHEGWKGAAVSGNDIANLPPEQRDLYLRTNGWRLLPREAFNEITAGTKPSGAFGRSIGKYQGLQSRILLSNPGWLQVQVGSNAFLSGFGVALKGGNPAHAVQALRWYSRQPDDVKHSIDVGLSNGVFSSHGEHTHLGASANNDIVNWVRAIGETPAMQFASRINPMDAIFRGDHEQNAYFRKVVLYSSLKREAFHDIGKAIGLTYEQQKKIAGILSIKDPEQRMRAIIRDPQLFEKHAEFVNRILGDYSRFTARERRYLKRGVLFYGFMRYSLRTLFYTLPVKHPLAAIAVGQLAKLHNQEVRDLLGGPDAPWAYSRIFFGGKKLSSIDFARANPVTNPIIDVATEGPQALGSFLSPAVQILTDQLYGKSLFSGQAFHVHGSAEDNPNPDLVTRLRIGAADLGATSFPYREAVKATQGAAKQGDDSLLLSARPIHYKTPAAQAAEQARMAMRGSGGTQVVRDLFPLVLPKPDNTRDVVAQRRRLAGKTIAGGRGGGGSLKGLKLPAVGSASASPLKGYKLPPIG